MRRGHAVSVFWARHAQMPFRELSGAVSSPRSNMLGWPNDRPGSDSHEADMPDQINPKFTWPRIVEHESGQAGPGLPARRSAPGSATQLPTRGGPNGATVEVRTLRELCHDLTMPATSIRLLVSAATRESDPDPALRTRLRQIADEAGRIADI